MDILKGNKNNKEKDNKTENNKLVYNNKNMNSITNNHHNFNKLSKYKCEKITIALGLIALCPMEMKIKKIKNKIN